MNPFMTKMLSRGFFRSIVNILDGFAYNTPNLVSLWNHQTKHKARILLFWFINPPTVIFRKVEKKNVKV